MNLKTNYIIQKDIKYASLEIVDVPDIVKNCADKWFNQSLCLVNESIVRLGILEGEFHWHKHDNDDEFFFCIEGEFSIELEDKTLVLNQFQGVTIPKGVTHRPVSPKKSVVLMVETKNIVPTGD
jgi:mannose-6-phosphate isomerase-like protein (cupin superfamily)